VCSSDLGAGAALLGLLCMVFVEEQRTFPKASVSLATFPRIAAIPSLLWVSLLCAMMQYTMFATTYGFLPIFAEGFGATKTDIAMIAVATLAPYTLAMPFGDRLARRVGERITVTLSLLLVAISVLIIPAANSISTLELTQVIGGVGRGIATPILMGLALAAVRSEEQATAMGVYQAMYAIGIFVGPIASGFLVDGWGIYSAFLCSGLVSLLSAAIALSRVRSVPRPGLDSHTTGLYS
jgi:MFS family permease